MSHSNARNEVLIAALTPWTSTVVGLLLSLLAACGSSTSTPRRRGPENVGRPTPPASAQAFERGDGVERDYEAAANIYERECRGALRDMRSCRRLLDAIVKGRGRTRDMEEVFGLWNYMCEHRDPLGCWLSSYSGMPLPKAFDIEAELAAAEDACTSGDAMACELLLETAPPNFGGSGAVDERKAELAAKACASGLLASCIRLIEPLQECPDNASASPCVDKLVHEWTRFERAPQFNALTRVREACDDGDAQACDALPGRSIPYAELCRAHDFAACGALGCLGDAGAAALAETRGVNANCYAVKNREAARHFPSP